MTRRSAETTDRGSFGGHVSGLCRVALTLALAIGLLAGRTAGAAPGSAPPTVPDGRWDASLSRGGMTIPFRLDLSGSGASLKGTLYDGFEPYEGTTSARYQDGQLVLRLEHYLTTISATYRDGTLIGKVVMGNRGAPAQYAFKATPHVAAEEAGPSAAPVISGAWEIPLDTPSSKGERAFRFIVRQRGAEVAASILRVDGDTGSYSGTYQNGKWVLSHFDGSRPGVIVVAATKGGTLEILKYDWPPVATAAAGATPIAETRLIAYRSEAARTRGLPEPENYETHTTVRDPREKFTFNFPDTHGKLISNEDPRFQGKVVLAVVSGTWCPNCHDEARYLVQLDRKYRRKGLAIVELDFEEAEQRDSLERERAFARHYGVKYTCLIAGAPAEVREKLPQLVNLNTWPATLFIGRDGTVRAVHSGFASPATGEFHSRLEREFTARIEQLLAER